MAKPLYEQTALEKAEAESAAEAQSARVQLRVVELQKVAAKASATVVVGPFGVAGSVTDVEYAPNEPIVLSATEPRTITVINRGPKGLGSAVVATRAFTQTGSAQIQNKVTLTGSAVSVAVGDVLVVESHDVGATGTADPGGILTVSATRAVRSASGVANEATGYVGAPIPLGG